MEIDTWLFMFIPVRTWIYTTGSGQEIETSEMNRVVSGVKVNMGFDLLDDP